MVDDFSSVSAAGVKKDPPCEGRSTATHLRSGAIAAATTFQSSAPPMNPWSSTTGGETGSELSESSGPLSTTLNEYTPASVSTVWYATEPQFELDEAHVSDKPEPVSLALADEPAMISKSRGMEPRSTPTPPPGSLVKGAAGGETESPSSHAPVPNP